MKYKPSATMSILVISILASVSWADEYVVTIESENPRLASVVAAIVPDGTEIKMNEEGIFGLENGWATFVENIQVFDSDGNGLSTIAKGDSKWDIQGYQEGPISLSYDVRLEHDELTPPIKFGDDGAAYAIEDGVMWSGRALFIAGKKTSDIVVRFNMPGSWQVVTPWAEIQNNPPGFVVLDTADLQNSAFFAGTPYTNSFNANNAFLKIALSGDRTFEVQNRIENLAGLFFQYFEETFYSTSNVNILIIAADRNHWGGEVMGRAISLAIGDETNTPPEFDLPGLLIHMIGHEMFHLFYNMQVEKDEENGAQFHWFNEGFSAEYVTYMSRVRFGDIDEGELLNVMHTQYEKYQASLDGELTLKTAGDNKAENFDMVYSGGLIAAFSLDFFIRDTYDGDKKLSDLWTYLLHEYPGGGTPLTLNRLVTAIESLYGKTTADLFVSYFNSPQTIPFYQNAELMGLRYSDGKLSISDNMNEKQKYLWNAFIKRD